MEDAENENNEIVDKPVKRDKKINYKTESKVIV